MFVNSIGALTVAMMVATTVAMTTATAVATVTSGFDEDSTATNLPIEISDDFIDIEDNDFLQELGFDPALAAARSRSFRRTGTLAQALDGTGDRFVDIDDSHTGALPQADSGTTTIKRRGRPPGSRNKKTLQTEAAIAGAMQALQAGGTQG